MVVVVLILLVICCLLSYLCVYSLCKKKKIVRVTTYGSILDRDPILGTDNMVYSPYTIGLNEDSAISEVSPLDSSYLNMSHASHMSKEDPIRKLTSMIPEDATVKN